MLQREAVWPQHCLAAGPQLLEEVTCEQPPHCLTCPGKMYVIFPGQPAHSVQNQVCRSLAFCYPWLFQYVFTIPWLKERCLKRPSVICVGERGGQRTCTLVAAVGTGVRLREWNKWECFARWFFTFFNTDNFGEDQQPCLNLWCAGELKIYVQLP